MVLSCFGEQRRRLLTDNNGDQLVKLALTDPSPSDLHQACLGDSRNLATQTQRNRSRKSVMAQCAEKLNLFLDLVTTVVNPIRRFVICDRGGLPSPATDTRIVTTSPAIVEHAC